MNEYIPIPHVTRLLAAGACLCILIAGLHLAATPVALITASTILTVVITGIYGWLRRRKMPVVIAVLGILFGVIFVATIIGVLLYRTLGDFLARLPDYKLLFDLKMQDLRSVLENRGVNIEKLMSLGLFKGQAIASAAQSLTGTLRQMLSNLLFTLPILVVLLESGSSTVEKLRAVYGKGSLLSVKLLELHGRVLEFVLVFTVINLITAVVITLWLLLFGIDFAVLWGMLIFMLNFAPGIGLAFAVIPAIFFAFIKFGLAKALLIASGIIALSLISKKALIDPRLSKKENLSGLTINLSAVFWSLVLGPLGGLISVPVTVALKMVLESFPETRWIAVIMSAETENAGQPASGGKHE